jgi:hypothetical protein
MIIIKITEKIGEYILHSILLLKNKLMVKKTRLSIPWLAVVAVFLIAVFGLGIVVKEIIADTVIPSVTVGNEAPTVGAVTLDGGTAITLVGNSTYTVTGTTTITDSNGYEDFSSVTSTLYLNNTSTCNDGVQDANWCYSSWVDCTTSSCSGNHCDVSCSADVWFIAEPSTASSTYPGSDWQMDITVVDSGSNSDTGSSSEELNILSAWLIGGSINYGTVNPGATSTEQEISATNTGNYHINTELSGLDMDDGSGHTIGVGQQQYSTSSTYSTGSAAWVALSGSPTELDIELPKPTATTSNSVDSIYWIIDIPDPQYPASYSGTNTADRVWSSS